jgi:hypothetical protein
MKKLSVILILGWLFFSCNTDKDELYTENTINYQLYSASDYSYTGTLTIKELANKDLEFNLKLNGNKSEATYFFPAHLHFGAYDQPDAPIAHLLSPIDIRTLSSTTVIRSLTDGQKLAFEDLSNLDAHIKVHLADSGPDYQVILSAGNIGRNDNTAEAFQNSKITVCSPNY